MRSDAVTTTESQCPRQGGQMDRQMGGNSGNRALHGAVAAMHAPCETRHARLPVGDLPWPERDASGHVHWGDEMRQGESNNGMHQIPVPVVRAMVVM